LIGERRDIMGKSGMHQDSLPGRRILNEKEKEKNI
jgi:hypothetical protein